MQTSPQLHKGGRSLTAAGLQVLSAVLILPLLKWAARRDKHFHTAPGMWNDELVRTNAGLFLLAGLLALAPAAVALFVGGRRSVSWMMIVVCTLFAGACELVVTVAPEPWFTW